MRHAKEDAPSQAEAPQKDRQIFYTMLNRTFVLEIFVGSKIFKYLQMWLGIHYVPAVIFPLPRCRGRPCRSTASPGLSPRKSHPPCSPSCRRRKRRRRRLRKIGNTLNYWEIIRKCLQENVLKLLIYKHQVRVLQRPFCIRSEQKERAISDNGQGFFYFFGPRL